MTTALLVFDCDGVILVSVDAKTQAFARTAERYGPEARDRLTLFHHLNGGVSRQEKFAWLFREVLGREITPAEMTELCAEFARHAVDNVLNAPLVPGALDVLERWNGRVPMYVCSGTPTEELRSILEKRGLARYFAGIYGTPPAKAERLAMIVREAGADPAETVMVGDSGTDMLAAEQVGTLFYGRGRDFAGSGHAWGEDLSGLNQWLGQEGQAEE